MKLRMTRTLSLVALGTFAFGSLMPLTADAQTRRRPVRRRPVVTRPVEPVRQSYTVNANSVLRVEMMDNLTSENARVGDTFTTRVMDTIYVNGVGAIPADSKITGVITTTQKANRKSNGSISVKFNSLQLPNGQRYAINGSLTDLPKSSNGSQSDNEGTVEGGSTTKRNVVFIGGGAAGGALIGAIAGGGKGAGIGAAIGAGAGIAGALFDKNKEAKVDRGTQFGVALNQSVTVYQ